MQHARIQDSTLIFPEPDEFRGIPNWTSHDAILRQRGYLPVHGEPEQRDGYTASPKSWHIVGQKEYTSYIQIDEWTYTPIPIPEPAPLPTRFSKGTLLEALRGCNLYEQARAIYAADMDLQIAWAGFADIDMEYPACQQIMQQYSELFTEENVRTLLEWIRDNQ